MAKPKYSIPPVGQKFNKWTVAEGIAPHGWVRCRCVCGTERNVTIRTLKLQKSKSCGCLIRDKEYWARRTNRRGGGGKHEIPIQGLRFGKLTVVEKIAGTKAPTYWRCICDCGKERRANSQALREGRATQCGCSKRKPKFVHGGWNTRTHSCWRHMKQRCLNPRHKHFRHYGGRGITICPQWVHDFAQFRADMGECPPNGELERIDVNGNYEPSNCKWANRYTQALNKRTNVYLEHNGERMTMSQFVERHGISYSRFRSYWRIKGMSIDDALAKCLVRE